MNGRWVWLDRATHVGRDFIKDHQAACALVQDSVQRLVQDHLRESGTSSRRLLVIDITPEVSNMNPLGFDLRGRELDELGNVCNLDPQERLDDTGQVLFQKVVVKCSKVSSDDLIVAEFYQEMIRNASATTFRSKPTFSVIGQSLLKLQQRPVLVCRRHRPQRLHIPSLITQRDLSADNRVHILGLVQHDLAE